MSGEIGSWALLVIPGILLLALSIAKPELSLAALVFVVYSNLSDVLIVRFGFPSLTQPLVGITLLSVFARLFLFQEKIRGWVQPFVLLGIYTTLGYISIFYAQDVKVANEALSYYSKNAIIGLLLVFVIQKPASLRWAIWGMLMAGILMGTVSVFQVFTGTYSNTYWGFGRVIHLNDGYRIIGSIGDANYYAQIMVALLPLAVERFLHHKSLILRGLAAWAFAVSALTILYTYSRGGFLAMMVVGFLLFIRQPVRPWTAAFFVISVGLIVFQFIPDQYTNRITSLFTFLPGNSKTSAQVDTSIQGRAAANIVGWHMFLDNPVFGVGVGNFRVRYDYYARLAGVVRETTSAHNLYLEIAAERGFMGFLSFAAILYFCFRALQRTRKEALESGMVELAGICDALTIGLAGYLTASLFLHGSYVRYLWVLLGIAYSTPQAKQIGHSASLMEQ
jgi:O-antigen ligase